MSTDTIQWGVITINTYMV